MSETRKYKISGTDQYDNEIEEEIEVEVLTFWEQLRWDLWISYLRLTNPIRRKLFGYERAALTYVQEPIQISITEEALNDRQETP